MTNRRKIGIYVIAIVVVTMFIIICLGLASYTVITGYPMGSYFETATAIDATNSYVGTLIAATQAAATATAKAPS